MLKLFLLIVAIAGLALIEPEPPKVPTVSAQGDPQPACPPFCKNR